MADLTCPTGTVFVPGGVIEYYGEEKTIPSLCWDEHEFSNGDYKRVVEASRGSVQIVGVNANGDTVRVVDEGKDPAALWAKYATIPPPLNSGIVGYVLKSKGLPFSLSPDGFNDQQQPMVMVDAREAEQLCNAQGKRLATSAEWVYVASQGGTKKYSTLSGESDVGVHRDATSTREVCQARGHYVAYDGKEICDLNGNVWEWTRYDKNGVKYILSGGSWEGNIYWEAGAHLDCCDLIQPDYLTNDNGFRCVVAPTESKE